MTLGQHDDELFQYEIADGLSKDDRITYPEDGLKEGMKTAVGSNGQMGQSNPVTDGDDMDLSNEDYSEKMVPAVIFLMRMWMEWIPARRIRKISQKTGCSRMSQMLMAAKMSSEERRMHSDS